MYHHKPNKLKQNPYVAAAAIGAGANILGSLIGQSSANMQYEQAKDLMKYQHDLNSIGDFVQQARESGYNPASLYGSASPSLSTSLGSPPDRASALSAGASLVQNSALIGSQISNIQADTNLKNQQAGMTALQQAAQKLQNDYLPQILELDVQSKAYNNLLTKATEEFTKENRKKVIEETNKVKKECDVMDKNLQLFDQQIREARSKADIAELQAKFTPELIRKNLQEIDSRIANNAAMVEQAHAAVQDLIAGKSYKEVQTKLIQGTMQYSIEEAASKKNLARTNEFMAENEYEVQKAGQIVNEFLSPARSLFSTFGSLFGGLTKALK